jgi:hypothetical protein
MNYKIHPFIFNWPGQYENCLKLENQLKSIFGEATVINSDDSHREDRWVNVGDEMYFTGQWTKAIELFDGDIMFHTQADAYCEGLEGFIKSALSNLEKYNWGIYEPFFDRNDIVGVDLFTADPKVDKNVKFVANTDCTMWLLHKKVIESGKENYNKFFSKLKYGWGISQLYASTSYKLNMPVLKDYNYLANHPIGTGYNQNTAFLEKRLVMREMLRTGDILDRTGALRKAASILKNKSYGMV